MVDESLSKSEGTASFKPGDTVRLKSAPNRRGYIVSCSTRFGSPTALVEEIGGTRLEWHQYNLEHIPAQEPSNVVSESSKAPAGAGPGAKDDSGKVRVDLVPSKLIHAVAAILTWGAFVRPRPDGSKGYGANNWQGVADARARYFAAMIRHLLAWRSDPTSVDADSGMPHLWHAATNLAFLISFQDGHDPVL